ncbi:MAG: hypothetical protein BroJett042_10940 [Bacteroidota bacterium]|nr:MAG: hypothetical protein BroJett042_10940 [Bacteroidota bacterium]
MLKMMLSIVLILICTLQQGFAQAKPKEKPPTQKEMEEMMREAQKMMDDLSDDDKKMMDSLGIKMPNFKNIPKVSDKQLAEALEKEGRIVPVKDNARIARIPKAIGAGQMAGYIQSTNNKTFVVLDSKQKANASRFIDILKQKNSSSQHLANAAMGLWMMGYPDMAFYLMGKACEQDATDANNLNNYASMLTMMGAAHLAIPVLDNINLKFPKNNTILNNLGQAWFQLGDISKAEKYIDEAIALYVNHSQANFTKCLIMESKGKIPEAVVALKRSIKGGHTPEKEAKLKKLGQQPDPKDDRFPQAMKNDPLNLGGFSPPPFPKTVMECVSLGMEWNEFKGLINQQLTRLEAEKQQATSAAEKFLAKQQNEDFALVKASYNAGRILGDIQSAPLYAKRAERQLNEVTNTYHRKIKDHMATLTAFLGGAGNELRIRYEEKMAKLRKEDLEQTGEGKPNVNFCPKYREVSDDYLKAYNSQLEIYFKEYLQIEKDYLNQSTHWRMYTDYPETYEAAKLGAQIAWLKVLKAASPYSFISITKYVCDPPRTPKKMALQKFDDVACKYKSVLKLPFGKIVSNCSKTYGEFDADFIKYSITTDAEKGESFMEQLVTCTVEVGVSKGKELEVGPVKVEAGVSATVGVEIDGTGIKDFFIGAGVEAGVELNETAGSTSAGLETKLSLISGNATVGGTGVFEKL